MYLPNYLSDSFDDSSIKNLIINTSKINIADTKPNIPISSAIFSNFFYNGVACYSYVDNKFWILPIAEYLPTAITTIFPSPESILLPLNKIGDDTSWAFFSAPS